MPIIPAEEISLLHAKVCTAVADPTRIRILFALSDGPLNVNTLADLLDTPQPTISRHLALLRQRSMVIAEREGVTVTYRLASPRVVDILELMRELLREMLAQQTGVLDSNEASPASDTEVPSD